MTVLLAILSLLLLTAVIYSVNALRSRTWTDLIEFSVVVTVWLVYFSFEVFFLPAIAAAAAMTIWNGFIVWKARKRGDWGGETAWVRLAVIPAHFIMGWILVDFWKLIEQM